MILFFFRRYNDLDHIVPIIYKMLSSGNKQIALLCLNNHYDIHHDFRLRYLQMHFDITIQYAIKYTNWNVLHRLFGWVICCSIRSFYDSQFESAKNSIIKTIINAIHLIIYKVATRLKIDQICYKYVFNQKWAQLLLKKNKCRCLVFDSAMHKKLYNFAAIRNSAKMQKITVIFVPHGLPLIRLMPQHATKVFDTLKDSDPDYIIVPHDTSFKEHVDNGFAKDKIAALGSTRFCYEWKGVLDKITPIQSLPFVSYDKLNVVYFARSPGRCGKYKQLISNTLDAVADLKFVNFVIKPHTRSNKFEFPELENKIFIANKIHSLNLIKWADVVIGTISSITIDVFIEGKPFLYPEYFMYDDHTFSQKFIFTGGYSIVKNSDQLNKTLYAIFTGKKKTQNERKKIIAKIVYNNKDSSDVLHSYENFINTKAMNIRHK